MTSKTSSAPKSERAIRASLEKSTSALSRRRKSPGASKSEPARSLPAKSKIAKVIEMLRRPSGASIKAIMSATGWQSHSVRGAISGAIKKKLGLKVASETRNGARFYRIGR